MNKLKNGVISVCAPGSEMRAKAEIIDKFVGAGVHYNNTFGEDVKVNVDGEVCAGGFVINSLHKFSLVSLKMLLEESGLQ